MKETILHKLNIDYPLKTEYQIAFIKSILHELERNGTEEIHDVVYEQLAVKLKDEKPEFSFKHFLLGGDDDSITIKEANSFIRDGTTGLKLWPAAMALAEFILQNDKIFDGKSILEIGSGATGFIGMVLIKTCRPEKVCLSDCHEAVLENLIENVNINLIDCCEDEMLEQSLLVRQRLKLNDGPELGVFNLPWEDVEKHEDELKTICTPNVLLAADVVYDDSLFDALILCIKSLFELSGPSLVFFLSQTVRNVKTYEKFCDLLHKNDFEIVEENVKPPTTFNWQADEIKILRISKQKN